jgi:hypothetical protein
MDVSCQLECDNFDKNNVLQLQRPSSNSLRLFGDF